MDDLLNNRKGISQIAKEYQVAEISVRGWISNYQSMGENGLLTSSINSSYSKELKILAIQRDKGDRNFVPLSHNNMRYIAIVKYT